MVVEISAVALYLLIFVGQLTATLIVEYVLSRVKETGKLKALTSKEVKDLKRAERAEIGRHILEIITAPSRKLTDEQVSKMYQCFSRLMSSNPDLVSKWKDYYVLSMIRCWDLEKGTAGNPAEIGRKDREIQKLKDELESEANTLIGTLE